MRDKSHFDENAFKTDLANIILNEKNFIQNDVNKVFADFNEKFLKVLNKHAPFITLSNKQVKWKTKPWLTNGIQTSIRKKNLFYGKYVRSKNSFWFQKYKFYCKLVKKLIFKSKQSYYNKYFSENLSNARKVRKGINEIIKNNKEYAHITLDVNGKIVLDQKQVANTFNTFFANVAEGLVNQIANPPTKFQDYLKNPNQCSIFLKEVDQGEVYSLFAKLDTKKAGDIYEISPYFVKTAATELSKPLCRIFNLSLKTGIFPDLLKIAQVIPLHKKNSRENVSNYRPISLLPIFSKLLEKIMFERLYDFICKKEILSPGQYGFQRNKCTEQAILNVQSYIIKSFEERQFACSIFLDFSKAFDTVNHSILLDKLSHYGIRGTANEWFASYLSNRSQRVRIGDATSDIERIKHGVPQGSILGPLLFLIYINDISNSTNAFKFLLFADDTCLLLKNKDLKELENIANKELVNVKYWLMANKLSINEEKTQLLVFHKHHRKSPNIKLNINNFIVEEKSSAVYLGIIIDNKLNFKEHTILLNHKLRKGVSIVAKLRHFVTQPLLKNIYCSYIESHLNYASCVWSSGSEKYLKRIKRSQTVALCLSNFKDIDVDVISLFQDNNVLPIKSLVKYNTCKLMWKIHKKHQAHLETLLTENGITCNVRDEDRYVVPYRNFDISKRFFGFNGPLLWNRLPIDLKSISSFHAFKEKLKEWLLTQAI